MWQKIFRLRAMLLKSLGFMIRCSNRVDSIKSQLAQVLCSPWVGRSLAALFQDNIPSQGCWFQTAHSLIKPAAKAKLFWGMYESAERRLVQKHLAPKLDVIELGDNIGFISSIVGQRLCPHRKLVCVEANPMLLELLRANVLRNAQNVEIAVIHGAIDYSTPPKSFVAFHAAQGLHSARVGYDPSDTQVPVCTLRVVLEHLGLADYQLVADIEGAEAGLILNEDLSHCRQLIIELHSTMFESKRYDVYDLIGLLQERHGFVLKDRRGNVCYLARDFTTPSV